MATADPNINDIGIAPGSFQITTAAYAARFALVATNVTPLSAAFDFIRIG
jgi:hypothetical protein